MEVIVVGGGPAGVIAARRAADLGGKTTLVTRDALGGSAANDGPVPVRTLAHAARLIREARQFGQYGIGVGEPGPAGGSTVGNHAPCAVQHRRIGGAKDDVACGVRQVAKAGAADPDTHEHEQDDERPSSDH